MGGILWAIIVVLMVMWILGLSFKIAGGLIHLLLVVAAIVLVYNLIVGYRGRGRV